MNVVTGSQSLPPVDGKAWGGAWPAPFSYSPPALGVGQIVAAQVKLLGFANMWMLADKLAPDDQVFSDQPNPKNMTSNWWTVADAKFAAPPVGPPGGGGPPGPPPVVVHDQETLSWVAPTQNEDLTPLTDLAGFDVYKAASAAALDAPANITATVPAAQLKLVLTNLGDGTFFFGVKAFNAAGKRSKMSDLASVTITEPVPTPAIPGQPRSVSITSTVTAKAP